MSSRFVDDIRERKVCHFRWRYKRLDKAVRARSDCVQEDRFLLVSYVILLATK